MVVIGKSAYENCSFLKMVNLSADLQEIGACAFRNCIELTVINFEGTKEQWAAIKKGENWDLNTGNYIICCSNGKIKNNC